MAQARLQEPTTMLIIRDGDPLCVETSTLTADSSVFKYMLEECRFEEEDMKDFSSEAVEVFVTLLRDKKMADFEDGLFREINKLAVAFKVVWLQCDCRRWFERKILAVSSEEEKTFVFDESYYALKRLGNEEYMDMFVHEFGRSDDTKFISRYLNDFDNLEINMLCPLLQLAGSNNEIILDILNKSVANNSGLSKNAMLILQNINIWCFQANWERWSSLLEKITELPEITVSDLRFISKLQSKAWRTLSSREVEINDIYDREKEMLKTVIYDGDKLYDIFGSCVTLAEIVTAVSIGKTESMRDVVKGVGEIFMHHKTPSKREIDQFILDLERLCQEKRIQRLPWQLIDLMMPVLRHSTNDIAENLYSLLKGIRQSKVLSSTNRENIFIKRCEEIEVYSTKFLVDDGDDGYTICNESEYKWIYRFRHPATAKCTQPGDCGFILKAMYESFVGYKLELVKDCEYYVDTGVHYHDVISARDMCVYSVYTLTLPDGTKLDTATGSYFFTRLRGIRITDTCKDYRIAYNVSDYMVTNAVMQ